MGWAAHGVHGAQVPKMPPAAEPCVVGAAFSLAEREIKTGKAYVEACVVLKAYSTFCLGVVWEKALDKQKGTSGVGLNTL